MPEQYIETGQLTNILIAAFVLFHFKIAEGTQMSRWVTWSQITRGSKYWNSLSLQDTIWKAHAHGNGWRPQWLIWGGRGSTSKGLITGKHTRIFRGGRPFTILSKQGLLPILEILKLTQYEKKKFLGLILKSHMMFWLSKFHRGCPLSEVYC